MMRGSDTGISLDPVSGEATGSGLTENTHTTSKTGDS